MGARVRVTPSCVIDADELDWKFTASGGPGGQHANTANTRVEVRFDIASSPSLGPRQRLRLLERIGPTLRVVASDRRSQAQNRELALDRLKSKLAAALHVDPARRPSRPSKTAVERRLEDKRRQGERKAARRVLPRGMNGAAQCAARVRAAPIKSRGFGGCLQCGSSRGGCSSSRRRRAPVSCGRTW